MVFKIKTLSTALTNAISGNSTRYYGKFSVEGKDYTTTLNNFKYNNIINPNNDISLGNTCASSVTFSIYMPQVSLENKEIVIYEGAKVGSNIEYIKLGIFIIDKQESDGEYTKYTGYDRMYKADMPYFSELTYPSTDKAILQEICSQMNISLATNIATTHTISEKPNGYTRREMIGYMAMLQGRNAVINSDGNLVLKWYTDSGYALDGHKYYQQGITFTTSKDFVIEKLTCNNTASGATEQSEITSGSGATGLTLSNPFMTQANLDEIYKKIGGFTFRPLTVKFIGDFRLEVGDIITVSTKDGSKYKVPIMQITHECDGGLISTTTSIGQSESSNNTASSGPITKAMQRYYAELVTINKALINKLDVETAKITYATIIELNATNATIDNLKTSKLDATYADIINANVENLKTVNADITNLKANSLTADIADIRYAQIDFANVKEQVIGTSLIKDGAVTNEKVQSLSANKLTAGIIDASKITVTNLNADNLTVGTINGKLIGKGSVDLNKLSQEVPTKEYLDKVQEDLQGQIDGNIETFTKTEIPTLNNEPAINWKDNTTRKKHIGDICYVVNPQSSADGYSYRFANTGTMTVPNYEWVLIKDSDVTKALQDIININGEITGIKKFDTEVSNWQTNTNNELSSLKKRTTTLETDIDSKVSTTVFNEVKQTIDENSSNITKLSETVNKKADSSTVTAISNTVNSVKQTAENNSSSISKLTTTVEDKADASTVTTISNKMTTLQQNLDGFKTTVSSTYTTKSEFNNLSIGGRNLYYTHNIKNMQGNYTAVNIIDDYIILKAANSDVYIGEVLSKGVAAGDRRVIMDIEGAEYVTFHVSNQLFKKNYYNFLDSDKKALANYAYIANNKATIAVPDNAKYLTMRIGYGSSVAGTEYKLRVKVEKGNKATDWTPAPEDVDSSISTVNDKFSSYSTTVQMNSAIETSKSGILSTVSGTYATKASLNTVDGKFANYSTTVQMNNAITQAVSAESSSIKLEVSGTYATKNDISNLQLGGVNRFIKSTTTLNKYITATGVVTDGANYWDLTDYIDVSKWTHYIASGWTNLGNAPATCFYDSNKKFISGVAGNNTAARYSLPIPTGAAYMRFSYAHVDTDKLKIEKGTKATDYSPAPEDVNAKFNNYATTASLTAYIAKTDTGALKSCIEAIADDINLTAGGAINISGNKSVNISGDKFSLDSSGTKISSAGYLQTVNAKLGEWNVDSKAIYCVTTDKVYTAYLQNPDYVVGATRENAWVYSVQKNRYPTFYVTSEGEMYCKKFNTPWTGYKPNSRWTTQANSIDTTIFIRTFRGPCLLIANASVWTDTTNDKGTVKCGMYLDEYCVSNNQHRLEEANAIEIGAGSSFVWYFSDNEEHNLTCIGGSTKTGQKTMTYSVQALFNNDVGWGTGQ